MKRLGLWATAVIVILLAAPAARASATERPGHWQPASAISTSSMTARVSAEPVVPGGGWTDQDSVETAGIGVLVLLGATAFANRSRSASSARAAEDRQRDELMLSTLDDILAAVDSYLLLRKPGEAVDKSVVREVLSGLYQFQRLADKPPIKGADEFRRLVIAALTMDLDAPAESDPVQIQIGDQSLPIPPDSASLSDLIHYMVTTLREEINAQRVAA